MTKKEKVQSEITNKKAADVTEKAKVAKFKEDLHELYSNLEKYFAIDFYYQSVGKQNPNRLARTLLSKLQQGHKVLEVGLNPGVLTIEAALTGATAIGIDVAPMKVVIAENLKHIEYDKISLIQKLDDLNLSHENILSSKFNVMSYEHLDFADDFFHVIYSNEGLEDCNLTHILDEMKRCLVSKGLLLLHIDLDNNLLFDIGDESGELNVTKAKYLHLCNWAEANSFDVLIKEVKYKGLGKFLVSTFTFLKEKPVVSPWIKNVVLYLRKP